MKWLLVPNKYLVDTNDIQLIMLGGRKICLVYHQKKWYAFQARCPHAGAPLVQGVCKNGSVICPYHRHCFDLETGRGAAGQGNFIHVYPVKEKDGAYYVGIKPTLWEKLFR